MKVKSEHEINNHYDRAIDRARTMALDPEHVIALIELDRANCLELVRSNGVVNIRNCGQLWEVIG